ncbi:MAG: hypothetical protein ACRD82_03930, partial [Blastocatellia bacterium]
ALNRNTSVTEAQQNSSGTWTFNLFTQNFGYDRWGNRTVSCAPCQSGVTGNTFTMDTATNRITAKNGDYVARIKHSFSYQFRSSRLLRMLCSR